MEFYTNSKYAIGFDEAEQYNSFFTYEVIIGYMLAICVIMIISQEYRTNCWHYLKYT